MTILFIPKDILEKLKSGEILFTELEEFEVDGGNNNIKETKPEHFVYIVKVGKWYKIGRTNNIKSRMAHYVRHDAGVETILSLRCNDSVKLEKIMLLAFLEKRVGNTEWYALSKKEVQKLIKIAKINI